MNIGTYECIVSKRDIRQFMDQEVSNKIRLKILEAGRQSGTGLNTQHLRFVLVDHKDVLKLLAEDSTSGSWVSGANFAIIVLTSPNFGFSMIDAGRALQNMQLAAWSEGIGSGLFTGVREEKMRKDFNIPENLNIAVILGFGYPSRKLIGKVKNRMPLDKLVYHQKYGNP